MYVRVYDRRFRKEDLIGKTLGLITYLSVLGVSFIITQIFIPFMLFILFWASAAIVILPGLAAYFTDLLIERKISNHPKM